MELDLQGPSYYIISFNDKESYSFYRTLISQAIGRIKGYSYNPERRMFKIMKYGYLKSDCALLLLFFILPSVACLKCGEAFIARVR
jgi:hypothetical protein